MAYIRCGGAGAEKPTLLWTNPNPTSAYAGGTISVPVTDYRFITIEARTYYNWNAITTITIDRDNSTSTFYLIPAHGTTAYARYMQFNEDSIYFESYAYQVWGSGQSSNQFSIPLKIWGYN